MATRINAKGIILRRTEYGEADRIITLLTDSLGKITAIAKGSRRLKSKLAGGIELLTINELGLLPGRSMYTLTSSRTTHQFKSLAGDLTTLNFVYDILSLVAKTVEDGEGSELFVVLEQTLLALDDGVDRDLVKVWFYIALLTHYGQQPNLQHDANGVELGADLRYFLQPSSGTLVPSESDEAAFDASSIKSLRLMSRYDPRQLNQISGVAAAIKPTAQQVEAFTRYQLGV